MISEQGADPQVIKATFLGGPVKIFTRCYWLSSRRGKW